MSKPPTVPPVNAPEPADQSANRLVMAICRNVVAALGRPDDFLRITARQVTEKAYRVNVVAGPDAASTRIAHSFFITADEEGKITSSTPAIRHEYPSNR